MPDNSKSMPAHARRALEEAELRRRENANKNTPIAKEFKGRKGLDPVRYGDWEKKGIAVDF